jgi:adenylate kinase
MASELTGKAASRASADEDNISRMGPNAPSRAPGPLLFLGPPGAGKGTQAREICRRLGIPHISTGDMLRGYLNKGTPLGLEAKSVMEAGELVRDDLVNEMVRNRLGLEDCREGFLLDGYPRTLAQAEALKVILKELGQPDPVVVNMHVSYNIIVRRLSGRRVCPVCGRNYNLNSHPPSRDSVCDDDGASLEQRSDDREEAVRERLFAYQTRTAPLVDFYRRDGRLIEVNADQRPEEISGALTRLLQVP